MDLRGKRVLLRVDFNVPTQDGRITDDTRIRAAIPGIRAALAQRSRLMLVSHFGRPTEGEFNEKESLAPVARHLSALLGEDVPLKRVAGWKAFQPNRPVGGAWRNSPLQQRREKRTTMRWPGRWPRMCDVYVNDAFGTAPAPKRGTH